VLPRPFFFPADSLTPGANFAQEARWAAVGKRDMSSPISAMITRAETGLMPGISLSAPILTSSAAMSALMTSRRPSICVSRKAW
jgi:hypothetical protein